MTKYQIHHETINRQLIAISERDSFVCREQRKVDVAKLIGVDEHEVVGGHATHSCELHFIG